MEMIAWMMAGFWFVVCLALSRRVVQLEEDVRVERTLCEQAEKRAKHAEKQWRCYAEISRDVARKSPMHFAGQPTLDATAYRVESNPQIVWWTYDS